MQRHMLSPPDPHTELEPFKTIKAADPLPIHQPAFAPQEDPNPQIAKPWTRMRQIPNAEA